MDLCLEHFNAARALVCIIVHVPKYLRPTTSEPSDPARATVSTINDQAIAYNDKLEFSRMCMCDGYLCQMWDA